MHELHLGAHRPTAACVRTVVLLLTVASLAALVVVSATDAGAATYQVDTTTDDASRSACSAASRSRTSARRVPPRRFVTITGQLDTESFDLRLRPYLDRRHHHDRAVRRSDVLIDVSLR